MSDGSSGTSSITRSHVVSKAEDLANSAKGIKGELDNLTTAVGALSQQWDGQAQIAYNEAQKKWTTKVEEMNQLLQKISAQTIELAGKYGQQDQKSAGRFTH